MHRSCRFLALVIALVLLTSNTLPAAWLWGEKPLCTIGGESYTAQDFKVWWKYYRDEASRLPEYPEAFIDWQLQVKEAEDMGLDQEPSFLRQVGIFLKVRSLLLLKNEEIDAKLNLTPDQIRVYYEQEYCPQYQVEVLHFHDAQLAEQAAADLRFNRRTMEYYEGRSNIHGAKLYYEERHLRPKEINSEWLETVAAMQVGDVSPPQLWKEGYVVFRLRSKIWFDEADFEKQKEAVTLELRKIHEARLTVVLVNDLMEKYHVQINRQLFAALDPYETSGTSGDAILITASKGVITVNQFLEQVRKRKTFFKEFGSIKAEHDQLKQRALNNLLSQTLTGWAALDRHYEKESPLKEVYQFYKQYRLTKELEKRLFDPELIVGPEEVETYYRQHEAEFTQPGKMRIASMEYNGGQINRIWAEIMTGGDFEKIAEKYTDRPVVETEQFTEKLDPTLKDVLARLRPGEVAPPLLNNGHWLLVKLIDQRKTHVEPLEEAAGKISTKLQQEKFDRVRTAYLELLKTKISITLNDSAWQALLEDMAAE